jgi:hypothetical protein
LLYETGHALEAVVARALAELGATLLPLAVTNQEDVRLVTPAGDRAVVEVKGELGTLSLQQIRQARDWANHAANHDDFEAAAVLVVNLRRDRPPDERGDALGAPTLDSAVSRRVAVLTTSQIYRALQDHQNGEFDSDTFWAVVVAGAGRCDVPELTRATGGEAGGPSRPR